MKKCRKKDLIRQLKRFIVPREKKMSQACKLNKTFYAKFVFGCSKSMKECLREDRYFQKLIKSGVLSFYI